jgi:hypothetical protein
MRACRFDYFILLLTLWCYFWFYIYILYRAIARFSPARRMPYSPLHHYFLTGHLYRLPPGLFISYSASPRPHFHCTMLSKLALATTEYRLLRPSLLATTKFHFSTVSFIERQVYLLSASRHLAYLATTFLIYFIYSIFIIDILKNKHRIWWAYLPRNTLTKSFTPYKKLTMPS